MTATVADNAAKVAISTHTLTWSVTDNRGEPRRNLCDFNSHAHVERDFIIHRHNVIKHISTHTLTWSVTFAKSAFTGTCTDFNSHAHVERDKILVVSQSCLINFNSHAHVERDKSTNSESSAAFSISTHTLTWSVTPAFHFIGNQH